jgi:uncharacterized membrane protein
VAEPPTRAQWFFEGLSLLLVIFMFAMVAVHWSQFPDQVPTHFGFSGKPNGWRGKGFLLILPCTAAIVWVVMTVAQRYQRLINLPFTIDRDSPEVQSALRSMMIAEKTTMALLFAWLMQGMVRTALGRAEGLGQGFLPLALALIFTPLIVYSAKLLRLRNGMQ